SEVYRSLEGERRFAPGRALLATEHRLQPDLPDRREDGVERGAVTPPRSSGGKKILLAARAAEHAGTELKPAIENLRGGVRQNFGSVAAQRMPERAIPRGPGAVERPVPIPARVRAARGRERGILDPDRRRGGEPQRRG